MLTHFSKMAAEDEAREEDVVSTLQLVAELDKQRSVLKEDISHRSMLIQESLKIYPDVCMDAV